MDADLFATLNRAIITIAHCTADDLPASSGITTHRKQKMSWLFRSSKGGASAEDAAAAAARQFGEAQDAINQLRASVAADWGRVADATRSVQAAEGLVIAMPDSEAKQTWRAKLEELQRELQMATATAVAAAPPPPPSAAAAAPPGGPGLDDLFTGLQLAAPEQAERGMEPAAASDAAPMGAELAGGSPAAPPGSGGRRIKKVVRSRAGQAQQAARPAGAPAFAAPPQPGGGAAAAADDGGGEWRPRLHVEIPELPQRGEPQQQASHGSANSTMARGGGGRGGESDSDESITSPGFNGGGSAAPPAPGGGAPA
jgi:hypothetical protein